MILFYLLFSIVTIQGRAWKV